MNSDYDRVAKFCNAYIRNRRVVTYEQLKRVTRRQAQFSDLSTKVLDGYVCLWYNEGYYE